MLNEESGVPCRRSSVIYHLSIIILALPNLEFVLQLDRQSFADPSAEVVDQAEDVVTRPLFIDDDVIVVPVGDFGAADFRTLEAGLLDQIAGAQPLRIFEDQAGRLMVERYLRLLHD